MVTPAAIQVGHLPNLVQGQRAPLWWAMVMLLVIEAMVFGTLIATYFYLRMHQPEWPPGGVAPPDLLLPTLNTLLLMASSLPVYLADHAITEGNSRRLTWGMALGAAMALTFLVLKALEYSAVPYAWDDHSYGSIVWLMVGFHSAHVLSVVLKTVVVAVLGARGYFDAERNLGVQINGLYWHFVVAVWLPLYGVIYWAPRLLE